jgi:hypothetical protein
MRRNAFLTTQAADRLDALQSETGRLLVGLFKALKAKAKEGTWDRSRTIREGVGTYELDIDL